MSRKSHSFRENIPRKPNLETNDLERYFHVPEEQEDLLRSVPLRKIKDRLEVTTAETTMPFSKFGKSQDLLFIVHLAKYFSSAGKYRVVGIVPQNKFRCERDETTSLMVSYFDSLDLQIPIEYKKVRDILLMKHFPDMAASVLSQYGEIVLENLEIEHNGKIPRKILVQHGLQHLAEMKYRKKV